MYSTRRRWYSGGVRYLPLLIAVSALLFHSAPAGAQVVIQNPSLPVEESAVYTEKVGDDSWTVTQTLSLRSEKGESWYEFTSHSP